MIALLVKAERALFLLGGWMVIVFMAITLVFTIGQAVDRYALHSTFNSHDQIAQIALVWLTFLGFIYALRENANIRVDLVDGWLPSSVLRWRNIVADVGALILFVIIQVKIWRLVELGAQQTIIGTPFSSDIVYMALAVGSAWGIVVITVRLVLDLTGR